MSETGVRTVAAIRIGFRVDDEDGLPELGEILRDLGIVIQLVAVRDPIPTAIPGDLVLVQPERLDDWRENRWDIVDIRLGSLTVTLTSAAVVAGGAVVALPALMTFLESIRDWTSSGRKAKAEAAIAEIELEIRRRDLLGDEENEPASALHFPYLSAKRVLVND